MAVPSSATISAAGTLQMIGVTMSSRIAMPGPDRLIMSSSPYAPPDTVKNMRPTSGRSRSWRRTTETMTSAGVITGTASLTRDPLPGVEESLRSRRADLRRQEEAEECVARRVRGAVVDDRRIVLREDVQGGRVRRRVAEVPRDLRADVGVEHIVHEGQGGVAVGSVLGDRQVVEPDTPVLREDVADVPVLAHGLGGVAVVHHG